MRTIIFFIMLAGCGGTPASTSSPAPATTVPPYMHPELCKTAQQQCAVEDCVKWKTEHGEDRDKAQMECPQACGCAE